ncbi:MAG: hypothetical protein AVO38_10770 [delta proteobacterium ML8_D]|jgi:hypothetical protein|nr:MAG: hypothetical protein AVO38_10770 [delta proteobacterium ML8_D]
MVLLVAVKVTLQFVSRALEQAPEQVQSLCRKAHGQNDQDSQDAPAKYIMRNALITVLYGLTKESHIK